ncbi:MULTISPECIES: Gfo/Idh/MocA family oxidoreductase [unclassified Kitasatospora]|uniref:Gfo/Idh/MocA family oxidoreductase n=1 Tax=unclassified Kitasatospora TaxID=2633591 RepID=UPI001ADFA470|nr:Gfo/Idh/MocA family oxidoreductase [Kitasatospora sp. RG8]MBP0451136.1 Gfo/Idh/MocA family oxidoreductase [Kitasatospora sp. RG8]
MTTPLRVCLVGFGVAGRLHEAVLRGLGAELTIVEPQPAPDPTGAAGWTTVEQLPDRIVASTDLWSVCCPTGEHLRVLRAVLARQPGARVLLEKPACPSHEIAELRSLLAAHPQARVVVIDQYAHARALDLLTEAVRVHEPGHRIPESLRIVFTKDRSSDIAAGRFVDLDYGVLGYEWLHMLAVLRRLVPPAASREYLGGRQHARELHASYHPELFTSALTERTELACGTELELHSAILGPAPAPVGPPPTDTGGWRQLPAGAEHRSRFVLLRAGDTAFRLDLDPVAAAGGWRLPRNAHRLTVQRGGRLLADRVIHDSPLDTAIRRGIDLLQAAGPGPRVDLTPLELIARTAEQLRLRTPTMVRPG